MNYILIYIGISKHYTEKNDPEIKGRTNILLKNSLRN